MSRGSRDRVKSEKSESGKQKAEILTCPSDPGEGTIVRASKPQNSGIRTCSNYRVLGLCPPPAQGAADITALYTARYGVPTAGKRLFVQCNLMVDGFESLPRTFTALVPQAS